eukprot:SAG11_NODE_8801_length_974_cov_4.163094_2_plen_41_part_01
MDLVMYLMPSFKAARMVDEELVGVTRKDAKTVPWDKALESI